MPYENPRRRPEATELTAAGIPPRVANLMAAGFDRQAAEYEVQRQDIAAALSEKDPSLGITAIIMAGDILSAQRTEATIRETGELEPHVWLCGSYGRVEMAWRLWNDRLISDHWLKKNLPELWRGSDPDDTDPRFLQMWEAAHIENGSRYLKDGVGLPRQRVLDVYRGQDRNVKPGIAWSLSRDIAEKFARGAALRQSHRDGEVLHARVRRDSILGYMTGRKEEEVIFDPFGEGVLY